MTDFQVSETDSNQSRPHIFDASGDKFYLAEPEINGYSIKDIASTLSKICRYGGQIPYFYCVVPSTRILTSELEWKEAGELRAGDLLYGFDEHTVGGVRGRRKIRPSKVLYHGIITRPVYKITLEDGSCVTSSAEHPWLITQKISRNQSWKTTEKIYEDVMIHRRNRYMFRFLDVWEQKRTRDAGWLAGIFDGEGSLGFSAGGFGCSFVQNPGDVLSFVERQLQEGEVTFSERKSKKNNCFVITISGRWNDRFKFLGSYRPIRLIKNLWLATVSGKFCMEFRAKEMLRIVDVEYCGLKEVAAMETSTRTYIAEGFGAHNSVAQHSIFVSELMEDLYGESLPRISVLGLLHDANEAYYGDVVAPLKPIVGPLYQELKERCEREVFLRFGLLNEFEEHRDQLKIIDRECRKVEVAYIRGYPEPDLGWIKVREISSVREQWDCVDSEIEFLNRIKYYKEKGALCLDSVI